MTKGFSSEEGEIMMLRWAGKVSGVGGSPSFSLPMITKRLLFAEHCYEQERQDPCLYGACRGGFEEPGNRA